MADFIALCAAVAFAGVFLVGAKGPFRGKWWHRSGASAAAGVSVAYVFVHLLPALSVGEQQFVAATSERRLPFPQLRLYIAALIGFVVFYGMDTMVEWLRRPRNGARRPKYDARFLIHFGVFSVYVWLVSYLLLRGLARTVESTVIFAVAMTLHFYVLGLSLLREHGRGYMWPGRQVLASAALLGWLCGVLIELPRPVILTLAGIIAGGVIMNSMVFELPTEKEGRFWPFAFGAAVYTGILLLQ
jgi:hypothetical protein